MMMTRAIAWMLVATAGLSSTGMVRADDNGGAPLSGPKVKDHAPPGERRTLSGRGSRPGESFSPRVFARALRALEDDGAPEHLRLSAGQRSQIEAIRADHEAQVQAYRDAHRAELLRLRESLPEHERGRVDAFLGQRKEGGPREAGKSGPRERRPERAERDAPMADDSESARVRERLREIVSGAPKPADAHARTMAVLNDAQKDAVKREVERLMKEARDHAQDRPGAPEHNRPVLSPDDLKKLKEMSPQQRREHIKERAMESDGESGRARKPK